jgi:hypothetical protein
MIEKPLTIAEGEELQAIREVVLNGSFSAARGSTRNRSRVSSRVTLFRTSKRSRISI